jgi:hypothetical protein
MNDQIAFNAGRAEGRIEGAEILCGIIIQTVQGMIDKSKGNLDEGEEDFRLAVLDHDELKTGQAKIKIETSFGAYGSLSFLKDELGKFFPTIQSMFDDVTKEEQALAQQDTPQEAPSTELPPDFHG